MITYELTEEKFTLDGEPYTGYGVAGFLDGQKVSEVRNISCNRAYIEDLVRLCRAYQVALVHLRDVAEDYITD